MMSVNHCKVVRCCSGKIIYNQDRAIIGTLILHGHILNIDATPSKEELT